MNLPDGIHQKKLLTSCLLDGKQKAVYPTITVLDGKIIHVSVETCEDGSGSSLCKKCTGCVLDTFMQQG